MSLGSLVVRTANDLSARKAGVVKCDLDLTSWLIDGESMSTYRPRLLTAPGDLAFHARSDSFAKHSLLFDACTEQRKHFPL